MAYVEHARDRLTGPITEEYLQRRICDGWKPTVVEWQRETAGEREETISTKVRAPYGLRVAADCLHLEEDPLETSVLVLMLELIRDERPFSEIAEALNARGFLTRGGAKWTQIAVFKLLPRLIDAAPNLRRPQAASMR